MLGFKPKYIISNHGLAPRVIFRVLVSSGGPANVVAILNAIIGLSGVLVLPLGDAAEHILQSFKSQQKICGRDPPIRCCFGTKFPLF